MQRFPYGPYQLAYESVGSGDRHLVFLHGILMSSDMNRGIAAELARAGYRVHLLDLLEHGESDKPGRVDELRMDHYASQIAAFLDHLGLERVILGGVSLGAIVSLQFAVRHPTRVEALVLEMPVLENAVPGIVVLLAPLLFASRFLAPPMRALFGLARLLPDRPHFAYRAARSLFENDPASIAAILSGALVGPIAPTEHERRSIAVPALVIGHPHDALHPFNDAEALATLLPNARFVAAESILELRDRPGRLLGLIRQFLDGLPRIPPKRSGSARAN